MPKKSESQKLRELKREQNFKLDCTNKENTKYKQYNSLKDKFTKYIVPCPCNVYITSNCSQSNTAANFASNISRLSTNKSVNEEGTSIKALPELTRESQNVGKIVKNRMPF